MHNGPYEHLPQNNILRDVIKRCKHDRNLIDEHDRFLRNENACQNYFRLSADYRLKGEIPIQRFTTSLDEFFDLPTDVYDHLTSFLDYTNMVNIKLHHFTITVKRSRMMPVGAGIQA
jgi:hypothetical protein